MSRIDVLREHLQALHPVHLAIEDDSARHAGHAGARTGGHFNVRIVCAEFSGKNTIQRHRLVYQAVGDLINNGVHALSIQAQAPEEFDVRDP